eukprot:TRINITY_DN2099_c1_g1_i4.p1 TRINITY_DN2099_c1_g1~~TRINITY_DN2099_c1_g1_i4.p1  ORF type:complete len:350 (-),score=35.47 TRINITY_DN2099_c1_g1_i4:1174-2223(-)
MNLSNVIRYVLLVWSLIVTYQVEAEQAQGSMLRERAVKSFSQDGDEHITEGSAVELTENPKLQNVQDNNFELAPITVTRDCFTSRGCSCLDSWLYQGAEQQGCSNPDNDREGSWCEIDESGGACEVADGQFQDTGAYYGYCTCRSWNDGLVEDMDHVTNGVPIISTVPADIQPPQIIADDNVTVGQPVVITQQDCVIVINTGCDKEYFMAFVDGEYLPSIVYDGYEYKQSSGWWMLDSKIGDYTRWCSPTGSVGIYIQEGEQQGEPRSYIKVPSVISEEQACLIPRAAFDILSYQHTTDEDQEPFYIFKDAREPQELSCQDLGGEEYYFKLVETNTVLSMGTDCELVVA